MVEVKPSPRLAQWLFENGYAHYASGFAVDEAEVELLRVESRRTHPGRDEAYHYDWACYSILARNSMTKQTREDLAGASLDIDRWVKSSEAQAKGFLLLREKTDSLCQLLETNLPQQAAEAARSCAIQEEIRQEVVALRGDTKEERQFATGRLCAELETNREVAALEIDRWINEAHATLDLLRTERHESAAQAAKQVESIRQEGETTRQAILKLGSDIQAEIITLHGSLRIFRDVLISVFRRERKLQWVWRGAVVLLLSLIAAQGFAQVDAISLRAARGFAQVPHDAIILRAQDEGITLAGSTRAAGLYVLNCTGAGIACSWGGSTLTLTVGGGGGTTITVREVDGTPTEDSSILEFDQADGFVMTEPGVGQARIDLVNAPDAAVSDAITLTNITQITNRAIGDTTGDLAASRVDDGGAAATQALFSGAAGVAGFRAIADGDIPAAIARDSELPTVFYHTVKNEDVALTQRRLLNFTGAGVDCVDDAVDTTDCTIAGGGGFTSFNIDGDNNSPQTITDGNEALFVGGAGILTTAAVTDQVTIATASGETNFLASGALTCGAGTAGRAQIHTTPLQYCDNAATPALQYAAYGDSTGKANIALDLQALSSVVSNAEVDDDITLTNITQITTRSHTSLSDIGTNSHATIDTHIAATAAHGATGAVVGTTNVQTLDSKTISGGLATTTHAAGANFLSAMRHATDCTAVTDGVNGELCVEEDSERLFSCQPTAGGCDTAAEWILTGDGAGGGNSFGTIGAAVADAGADTLTLTDTLSIDLTSTDNPEDLSAAFRYDQTQAGNPALAAETCIFTTDGTGGGGLLCEGTTADTNEGLLQWNPTTDKILTLPDATDTLVGRDTTDTLTNKTITAASNAVEADDLICTNCIGATEIADLDVVSGGTGAATLTGLLQGNGTAAFTAITNSSTVGQALRVTAASTYAWGALDLADPDAVTGILPDANHPDASDTAQGITEYAIASEVNTGTSTTLAITPNALNDSEFGKRIAQAIVFNTTTTITTGDNKVLWKVPTAMVGMNLVSVQAQVSTVSSSGAVNVDLARCAAVATGNACSGVVADMLSTNVTIDANEDDSDTAAAPAVVDTLNDDIAQGQSIRIDVDLAGTGAQGLLVVMEFQLP